MRRGLHTQILDLRQDVEAPGRHNNDAGTLRLYSSTVSAESGSAMSADIVLLPDRCVAMPHASRTASTRETPLQERSLNG